MRPIRGTGIWGPNCATNGYSTPGPVRKSTAPLSSSTNGVGVFVGSEVKVGKGVSVGVGVGVGVFVGVAGRVMPWVPVKTGVLVNVGVTVFVGKMAT